MKLMQCVKLCSWPGRVGGGCPYWLVGPFLASKNQGQMMKELCVSVEKNPMLEGRNIWVVVNLCKRLWRKKQI